MVGTGCRLPNFVVQPKKHSEKQILKQTLIVPNASKCDVHIHTFQISLSTLGGKLHILKMTMNIQDFLE